MPKREHGDIASLKQSIKDVGLIAPLVINERYELLAGRRRFQAMTELGWDETDCHLIRTDGDLLKSFRVALDENLKRKDLTDPEVAAAIKEYDTLKRQIEGEKKPGGDRQSINYTVINDKGWTQERTAKELGISQPAVVKALKIASAIERHPELAKENSGQAILREAKRKETGAIKPPVGKYRTIVIDPPWPIEKIEREVRPNQQDIDYSVMTLDEIKAFSLRSMAFDDGCHVYLWTTHKWLPVAFDVFRVWNVNYQCLLTWIKNVGFTPFSWMYSTEHCLFGRVGDLPLLQMGKRLDFTGKVREHSRKPDEFYELVKLVSPEPRIDIFSREKRDGFEQYGNETDRFTA